mmetsp:Transcript_965/g.2680  ORF Transcript_965/g.2680 Transcript_965/m.2680 type:complete len:222 (+) Transcript_965:3403-4068(+)
MVEPAVKAAKAGTHRAHSRRHRSRQERSVRVWQTWMLRLLGALSDRRLRVGRLMMSHPLVVAALQAHVRTSSTPEALEVCRMWLSVAATSEILNCWNFHRGPTLVEIEDRTCSTKSDRTWACRTVEARPAHLPRLVEAELKEAMPQQVALRQAGPARRRPRYNASEAARVLHCLHTRNGLGTSGTLICPRGSLTLCLSSWSHGSCRHWLPPRCHLSCQRAW